MDSNNTILNPKNNSPWLLCISKSFPGKMYYFNTSTGESAWCLSEIDKNLKKGTMLKVTDKTHIYPEPFDPPFDDSTNTNTTSSFRALIKAGNTELSRYANETRPSSVFNQAVLPNYVSPDTFTSKFTWTPKYVPSQLPNNQMLDLVTQTTRPIFEPNYFQPLKTNFTPGFQVQNEPFQYKYRPMLHQTANFNCFNFSKETQTLAKPPKKHEVCHTLVPIRAKRLRTQSESKSTLKSALKASRSVENLTTLFSKDVEPSPIRPPHKVENETAKLGKLDRNDLRFKLIAKKRKVECATVTEKIVELADQSTSKSREILMPKTRVTFDIQETARHSYDDVQETDQSPELSRMDSLSRPTPGGPWYVVTDTLALLEHWQCIEEFVKSDPGCRLAVPHAVYTELEGRSRGGSGAMAAHQLVWKLAHVAHIVVQSKPEHELSPEDSILHCCWTLLQENMHVVLISNNTNILNKANSIDLECYTLDRIKKDNQTAVGPQNNLKKPNIIEDNYINKSKNLFMQDLSEVSGLCLPRPESLTVCASRKNVLKTGTSQFSKRDAYSDKLIDLTRPRENTTNVKEQFTKLSIAGTTFINNESTQIMKNVFRTTVPNKIDQDNTTPDIENLPNKNVPKKFNEVEQDISRLNLTENNKGKSADIMKATGITKLNNQFNLAEDLERFYIKNTVVENRVKSRFDEWVCRLNQTMEEVLTKILLKKRKKIKKIMPPWNLFEAIQVTGEVFKNQPVLKSIIDRFSVELLDCSSDKAKLNKYMKPNDLMKQIGLSFILIQCLKEIINSNELSDAEDMLLELIKNIEYPDSDIDLSLEEVNTPIFSRNEISKVEFRKSRKEIAEFENYYLTKSVNEKTINKEACGNDLNTLKINNTKAITVENKAADKADVANQKLNDGNYTTNNLSREFLLGDLSVSSSSVSTLRAGEGLLFVKIFLGKMKGTVKQIYNFLATSVQACQEGMPMDKKEMLIKSKIFQQHLMKATETLKRILARESNDGTTLKELLRKAGDDLEDNPIITNYEQVLMQFLDMTQPLEVALEHMISELNAVD